MYLSQWKRTARHGKVRKRIKDLKVGEVVAKLLQRPFRLQLQDPIEVM